jgi:hypothetical protein
MRFMAGGSRAKVLDLVSGAALIVVGLISVSLISLSGLGVVNFVDDRWLLIATLAVLSVLSIALGLERGMAFSAIEHRLASIETNVAGAIGGVQLRGHEAIFRHSVTAIERARDSLISVVIPGTPRAPEWWVEAVAARLGESKKKGERVTWRVNMAVPSSVDPAEVRAKSDERFKTLVAAGVEDLCTVWQVPYEERTGLDFLIVGGRSTYLTLPSGAGSDLPHHAIFFEDAPDIARHLVDWTSTLPRELVYSSSSQA